MSLFSLKNGRICSANFEEASGILPEALYWFNAAGEMKLVQEIPDLQSGEGFLLYTGDFYVEPLEIQIEFVKTLDAERWLEGLVLRHVERVRSIEDELYVLAAVKEVE